MSSRVERDAQVNYFDNFFKITCQMKMSNEGRPADERVEEKGRLPKKKIFSVTWKCHIVKKF